MKVTGQQLIQAIKEQSHLRDLATTEFTGSLVAFEKDDKDKPWEIMDRVEEAETRIALLQAAQGLYNQKVKVTVGTKTFTLAEAVKGIGGVVRIEKLWRKAAKGEEDDSIFGKRQRMTRSKVDDVEVAKPTITPLDANERAKEAAKMVAAFRSAIQAGNMKKIEIDLDPFCLD